MSIWIKSLIIFVFQAKITIISYWNRAIESPQMNFTIKSFYLVITGFSTLLVASFVLAQSPEQNKILKKYSSTVVQGVAVDADYFYEISNTHLAKREKKTGEMIANWEAPTKDPKYAHFKHLNSGTVVDEKLYCAHSRFGANANENTLEIWDVANKKLDHILTIKMPSKHGSFTWIDRTPDGFFWICYAVYGKDKNKETTLVKYQVKENQFTEIKTWKFPQKVIEHWGNYSCSGGSWGPDGNLYTTGHDHEEAYVLSFDDQDQFQYLRTEKTRRLLRSSDRLGSLLQTAHPLGNRPQKVCYRSSCSC